DVGWEGGDGGGGVAQEVGGQGEAPAGEEGHGRLADELVEAAGQARAGDVGRGGQLGHRPWVGWVVVEQAQGPADDRVAVRPVPRRGGGARAGGPSPPPPRPEEDEPAGRDPRPFPLLP